MAKDVESQMKLDPSILHAVALIGASVIGLTALLQGNAGLAGDALTGLFAVLAIPSRGQSGPQS